MKAGWEEAALGDIVTLNYGKALAKSERNPSGAVPVYGANGVMDRTDHFLAEGPSLVIGRKGTAGAITPVNGPFWPADVTYYTKHDTSRVDFRFLHYALSLLDLPSLARGVKPGINRNNVYALTILLPPREEQQRIVAILGEAFEGLDRAKANAETNLSSANELRESAISSIVFGSNRQALQVGDVGTTDDLEIAQQERKGDKNFRGPVLVGNSAWPDLPSGWRWASPEQLCTHIVDCLHSTPKWSDKGEICLRTTNFRPGRLDLSIVRYVSEDTYARRISRLEPCPGDVLYSREGGILGIACILPDGVKACLGQRMMQFRTNREWMLPEYLCAVLNSGFILREVRRLTGGAAAPHLNIGDIRRFPIPVPPLDVQRAICDQLRMSSTKIDGLAAAYSADIVSLEALRQSLLAKALVGELT